MTAKYPYVTSPAHLTSSLDQFKKSFPNKVDLDVLKKLSLAPSNEGTVINTMRFLGLIDEKNLRTEDGRKAFVLSGDEFNSAFSEIIKRSYSPIFELLW